MSLCNKPIYWSLAALIGLLSPTSARAEFVTFTFSGTLKAPIASPLDTVFTIGDQFTLAYTFDSTATPDLQNAVASLFRNVLRDFSIQVKNASNTLVYQASANLVGTINLVDDSFGEVYQARTRPFELTGNPIGDYKLFESAAVLSGTNNGITDVSKLPTTLDLSQFSSKFLQLTFLNRDTGIGLPVVADIASLEVTNSVNPVPEPSSLALASIGGCFLAAWRRRQVRQAT